jgi:pimeloyl-ACP methyl ester carboxylesterase
MVAMPGAGFDGDFAGRAFGPAARTLGIDIRPVDPDPDEWVGGYRRALDDAAQRGPVLAVGISIGACAAIHWALANPQHCAGVWAALPPWTGDPGDAPAALSARFGADSIERIGLDATIAEMRADSPDWLADELERSWRAIAAQGPAGDGTALVALFRQVASFTAPTDAELAALATTGVPVVITAATDDPVHPTAVAQHWRAASGSEFRYGTVTLDAIGRDRGAIGDSCAQAWNGV